MDVKHVLSQKAVNGVESIGLQETMRELVAKLADKKIGAVVVVDGRGKLAGVISERDIVRAMSSDGDVCMQNPVSRYMTAEVVTATPNDTALSVLERMSSGRFRHMPVLDGGELVGVVSIGDVVKARIQMLQRENQALEEFIRG